MQFDSGRKCSDKTLADERALADKRLADQLAHSGSQLAIERADADARLQEGLRHEDARRAAERRAARDAEQLAEAWAVQVVGARLPQGKSNVTGCAGDPPERSAAVVVNRGRYTITRVEARFGDGSAFLGGTHPRGHLYFNSLPQLLARDLTGGIGEAY